MDILEKLNSPTRLWLGSAVRKEAAQEIERLRKTVELLEHNAVILSKVSTKAINDLQKLLKEKEQ